MAHAEFLHVISQIQDMLNYLNGCYEIADRITGQQSSRRLLTQNMGVNEQRWATIQTRVNSVTSRYQEYKNLFESLYSLLCRALPHRNQERVKQMLYRLLTQELRDEYPFWKFVMGWSLMDRRIHTLMANIRHISIRQVITMPNKATIVFTCETCGVQSGSISLTQVERSQNNRDLIPDQWEISSFRVRYGENDFISFP